MKHFSFAKPSMLIADDPAEQESTIHKPDYLLFGLDCNRKILKIHVQEGLYQIEEMDPPIRLILLGYMKC